MKSENSNKPEYGTLEYFKYKILEDPKILFKSQHNPNANRNLSSLRENSDITHEAIQKIISPNGKKSDEIRRDIIFYLEYIYPYYLNWRDKASSETKKYYDIVAEAYPLLVAEVLHPNDLSEITTRSELISGDEESSPYEPTISSARYERLGLLYKSAAKHDLSGPVMIIGGAEDKTTHGDVLKKFFELSGGKGSDIAIITWASRKSDAGKNYEKLFKSFGAKDIFLIKKKSKKEAEELIKRAAGIFFIGGDQMKLIKTIEELNLRHLIHSAHQSGTTIGGTSAGASILGTHIPYWDIDKEKMIYHKGLNLIPDSIVDQHFTQRNRRERLEDGIKRFKTVTGYGLDEDTAIIFKRGKKPQKIGSGKVLKLTHKS